MSNRNEDKAIEAERTELISISNGKPQGDLQVARPVYRQEELHEASNYTKPTLNCTFAIVCLMTGQVVATYAPQAMLNHASNITDKHIEFLPMPNRTYEPIEVATAVTFVVAVIQMIMYILRLGIFTNLLSETLVNGFTCGAAFHVISSQLKDLFGLTFAKRRGYFSVLYTFYDALLAVPQANRTAVSISMVAVVLMVLNNEIFKPWLAKKTKVPFPIELAAVVIGTAVCYGFDFHDKYGVTIVGDIPTGLPPPALPAFSLMPHIIVDCLIITIVSYTITISMAFIFAQKAHYEVDANQELLALSLSNAFGSFFSTMPVTGSLARSLIQFNTGGVTQIASIVSCALLLVVLLWVGPLFEYLPKAILASIIVVALKGMLMQAVMLKKFWRLSKWDAIVWIITFLTTVVVSIDIGLLSGIVISLISIFVRGQRPYTCLLGVVPNTDLYLDCKRYKGVQEIEGIKIFHYCGALNFASKAMFKEQLTKKVGFDPSKLLAKIAESKYNNKTDELAVKLLRTLAAEYNELDVALYIASCSGPIFEMLAKCDKYEGQKIKINIYPTIHDAVLYAKLNEF
ncbi:sulfate transporter [Holotrichia oblita]|uniref:Sulfate transporter n=1 Tax=Holotrichia oblita TaxID=644536 RepID=A0ACB9SJK3_HOLOL|nr:sulfate transporter [Holotrichia oblita]